MLSHKSNMTFTNNSSVSEAWTCNDWQTQLFSDKTVSFWFLSSPKITREPEVKKFSWSTPKCPRHRTAHVLSQNINFTFFAHLPLHYILWPFQFKYCKILGQKSETQPFAASPPDEAFLVRVPTRQRQLLILETQPRAGSSSSPFNQSLGRLSCRDLSSQECQREEFIPTGHWMGDC